MYKKCIFALIVLCLTYGAYGASMTIVELPAVGTDAAIGIDASKTYTHAFDFGTGAPSTINGVAFDQGPTASLSALYEGVSSQGYSYTINDTRSTVKINVHGGNDPSAYADGSSAEMLRDMIYFSGAVANEGIILTFSDLTPGVMYSVHWYYRPWDPDLPRPISISADGGAPIDIDIDEELAAFYLDYTVVADDSDITMEFITNDDNQGVHLYGITCEEVGLTEEVPQAALIVSNTDLTAGFDQAQKDRLESMGYEVTVATGDDVSGEVFTAADAETFDVLVVSESISSSAANNLIGTNVPMMHQESYGWSRHFFTAGLQKAWVPVDGPIDIVSDHAIISDAGLSVGPLDFFSAPTNATSDLVGSLAPGAVNLAQVTSDANDFTLVFAIEQGGELSNGTPAANRVVGFSLPGTEPAIEAGIMTDEAWAFFEAAIRWLDPAPVTIDTGLVAYYALDGDVLDASGNGNDGTILGDPEFVEGVVGQALDLDGDGDYVDCNSSSLFDMETNKMTVATWVTIRSVAHQWAAIVAKGEYAWRLGNASYDPRFHFGISYGGLSDTTYFDGVTTVGFDEWHHVAGVFDGANMMIYLDGALDNSVPTTETIGTSNTNLLIGENPEATGRYWDGLVDEVYLYNRALSADEVLDLAGM